MQTFIELTRFNSDKNILIDFNKVVTISPDGDGINAGTIIDFGKSDYVVVNEPYKEVVKVLKMSIRR